MRNFYYTFRLRSVICLSVILLLMFVSFTRVLTVTNEAYKTTSDNNIVKVEINNARGNFYDCNGYKLTGGQKRYATVFLPTKQSVIRFCQVTDGREKELGLKNLKQNKPVVIYKTQKISGNGIYSFETSERYNDEIYLGQLIGYTDSNERGVYGLEKAFDEVLYSNKANTVSFDLNALGQYLTGAKPCTVNNPSSGAVYLTIDKEIQKICASASKKLTKGAVVVTETATGKIRALLSKPTLSVNDLASAVNNANSPFLNRAVCAYSVGSVFKPIVAAAMLENNKGDFCYTCNGFCKILGITFYCNNKNGHGNLTLENGLSLSCNTYFYNAAAAVKANSLYNLAVAFGFNNSVDFANGIKTAKGSLTSLEQLKKSKANIANFAIGQGNIALSPVVLSNLYTAIANDGKYISPTVIEGYVKNGKYEKNIGGDTNAVISKATAQVLKNYLVNAVNNGTGKSAKPDIGGAGGKTATAQTGQYKNGKEILNAWFCGFFPEDKPKYTVVVLAEDAISGGSDAAPIFKEIADKMYEKGFIDE